MGLGKTVQSISVINHLFTMEGRKGPFLVLAPLTTL
jgi:SNF2 family DNA or RNA helicase